MFGVSLLVDFKCEEVVIRNMNWKEKADVIHQTSTLSPRKAEIAVLYSQGLRAAEIQNQLYAKTGDKLTIESINATISKLRQERVNAHTTVNLLTGGVEQTKIPMSLPNKSITDTVSVHAYTGEIGSGKVQTALNHTYMLSEERKEVDNTIIFDPGQDDLLANLHAELTQSTRITVTDQTKLPINELLEQVRAAPDDEQTLVLVVSAYHVLQDNPDLIESLRSEVKNTSLRFVGKDLLSMISEPVKTLSAAHIFRTRSTEASEFVSTVEQESALCFTPQVGGFLRYLPAKKKQPSTAATVITKTGEVQFGQQSLSDKTPIN